jgi:hypothetical protein
MRHRYLAVSPVVLEDFRRCLVLAGFDDVDVDVDDVPPGAGWFCGAMSGLLVLGA